MFAEDYNQYILLQRDRNRSPWHVDKKTMLMVGCLVLPVTVFCATYMILFGIYERLIYPKSASIFATVETTKREQHRALIYNQGYSENYTAHFRNVLMHNMDKPPGKFRLVCYYNFPANDRSMQISEIDPNLCTHLNVAFARVVNNSIYLDDTHLGYLKEITKLKTMNKELNVLLSVGGAGNDDGFPQMVHDHTNRKTFIKSILAYVKDYSIDGVDLDWEFPGEQVHDDPYQRMHFTQLLAEVRKTISRQPKYSFLLTVAVAAPTEIIDTSYDVSYMNDYVDYINLMSYDYHYYTAATPFTGINSPLYPNMNEKYYLATLNINYSSHYWHSLGMDKAKINIGLPTYGHTFRLINPRNQNLYAPVSGYGNLGNLGFASYPLICNFLQTNHITPVFDMESFSPYAAKYYEWISFDDHESLTFKAEFIKSNHFGGAMVYCLNADDFKGECKMGGAPNVRKFPLVGAVKAVLEGPTEF